MKINLRHLATTTLAALLAACALPLQPDRSARAPELPGYGTLQWTLSAASPAAQQLFTQGVLQAYAFNEVEAVRLGRGMAVGAQLQRPRPYAGQRALRYLDHALLHAARSSAHEQSLIQALALRYGHAPQARESAPQVAPVCRTGGGPGADGEVEPAHPLDVAYAGRMRQLLAARPDDPDLLSLVAEAELIATPGDWWNKHTGQPAGRIDEVVSLLERALLQHSDHTGLNHYLVHAADAAPAAGRAVAAADRLGRLAPASPHLVHMPSHIYVRVGRYADAVRVNQQAVAADLALFAALNQQSFSISKDWRSHDQQFLWFAALMQGRGDLALAVARDQASRTPGDHVLHEYRRSMTVLALLRLERWDAPLAEPLPSGGKGMAQALGEGARGVALARQAKVADARAALARAVQGAARMAQAHAKAKGFDRVLREMTASALDRLRAEIGSESVNESGAPERALQTVSMQAQSG